MEQSQYFAVVALTATVGKVAYGYGYRWWTHRSLRTKYIERASELQIEHEEVSDQQAEELDRLFDEVKSSSVEVRAAAVRRVTRRKGSFRNYLVQKGQAKFGCPTRNEANRLTVRKYLYDLCEEHGLLARHINEHLDVATELVFVPGRNQITAAAVAHTKLTVARRQVMRELEGPRPTIA